MKRKPYNITPEGRLRRRQGALTTHKLLTHRHFVRAGKKGFEVWADRIGAGGLKAQSELMLHTRWHVYRGIRNRKCILCRRKRHGRGRLS